MPHLITAGQTLAKGWDRKAMALPAPGGSGVVLSLSGEPVLFVTPACGVIENLYLGTSCAPESGTSVWASCYISKDGNSWDGPHLTAEILAGSKKAIDSSAVDLPPETWIAIVAGTSDPNHAGAVVARVQWRQTRCASSP